MTTPPHPPPGAGGPPVSGGAPAQGYGHWPAQVYPGLPAQVYPGPPAPGPPGAPARPPVGAMVIIGRVLAFVTLLAAGCWGLLLLGIGSLSIMWGPLCGSSSECAPRYWSGIGTGLVGAVVAGLLLVIALPLAWRRPVLLFLALAGAAVLVITALAVLPGLGL